MIFCNFIFLKKIVNKTFYFCWNFIFKEIYHKMTCFLLLIFVQAIGTSIANNPPFNHLYIFALNKRRKEDQKLIFFNF